MEKTIWDELAEDFWVQVLALMVIVSGIFTLHYLIYHTNWFK